jgi:hypothetical protein
MPYEIKKVKGGYKVQKKGGGPMRNGRRFASDDPLPLERAKKQLAALYASENSQKRYSINRTSPKGYKVSRRDGKKLENGRYHSSNKELTYSEAKEHKKKLIKGDRKKG